ncbi:MAG: hypothetical protein ACK4ND_15145 [Cytophagaceae bacterium]
MTDKGLNIKVLKISQQEFFIDEEKKILNSEEEIVFTMSSSIGFDKKEEAVSISILVDFSDKNSGKSMLKGVVRTIFHVEGLNRLQIKNADSYDIPDNIMTMLLSLSVTHARAILATHTNGTAHSELLIPIINPAEFFNQIKKQLEDNQR